MIMRRGVALAAMVAACGVGAVAQAGGATTTTTTTSTTTTLAPACSVEPTFASIECRLAVEEAAVAAESALGPLQNKLGRALAKASQLVMRAEGQCANGDARGTSRSLKKAVRRLIQYNHRLGSLAARKKVPAEVRDPFREAGRSLQDSLKALKRGLVCPPASPSGAFVS